MLNILNLFLNLDIVCIILGKSRRWCATCYQYISPLSISDSALYVIFQYICKDLPDDVHSANSVLLQKEVENLSLCKSLPTLVSGFVPVFLCGTDPCYVCYGFLFLCIMQLESLFRWRLSPIKVLLELEYQYRSF